MAQDKTIPSEYPWWMHHPTEQMVLTQNAEEAQALVDVDPLWRLFPYTTEEKAAREAVPEPKARARRTKD
jgi:hypothetical protein